MICLSDSFQTRGASPELSVKIGPPAPLCEIAQSGIDFRVQESHHDGNATYGQRQRQCCEYHYENMHYKQATKQRRSHQRTHLAPICQYIAHIALCIMRASDNLEIQRNHGYVHDPTRRIVDEYQSNQMPTT